MPLPLSKNKQLRFILLLGVLATSLLLSACDLTPPSNNNDDFEIAYVNYVIDGDTLKVQANMGDEPTTLRLIGVDTPESVHPDESKNTGLGKQVSDIVKNHLPEGSVVWLEYDEDPCDKYGRVLAYIWLVDPTEDSFDTKDIKNVKNYMLNGWLLDQDYAQILKIPPNTKYADIFEYIAAQTKMSEDVGLLEQVLSLLRSIFN